MSMTIVYATTLTARCRFRQFPQATEGFLSHKRRDVVNNEFLFERGIRSGVARLLRYSDLNSDKQSSPPLDKISIPKKVIADVAEALIGAAYLDHRSSGAKVVLQHWLGIHCTECPPWPRPVSQSLSPLQAELVVSLESLEVRVFMGTIADRSHSVESGCVCVHVVRR